MNQIWFKHKTGSSKSIPGVNHQDLSPRMIRENEYDAPRTPNQKPNTYRSVLRFDSNHIVKVTLLDLDANAVLGPGVEGLPKHVREQMEVAAGQDYVRRVMANNHTIDAIKELAAQGSVEIVRDAGPVDEEEAMSDSPVQVNMSEIAMADHIARGISVPEYATAGIAPRPKTQSKPKAK